MAIVVEHDKRKHEILQKSLDVFVEQGYEDATFQKIADHCGITRTTLYIYFKNKHEIFLGSIKELLSELETNLRDIIKKDMDSIESLKQILFTIVDACENNKKLFFSAIFKSFFEKIVIFLNFFSESLTSFLQT